MIHRQIVSLQQQFGPNLHHIKLSFCNLRSLNSHCNSNICFLQRTLVSMIEGHLINWSSSYCQNSKCFCIIFALLTSVRGIMLSSGVVQLSQSFIIKLGAPLTLARYLGFSPSKKHGKISFAEVLEPCLSNSSQTVSIIFLLEENGTSKILGILFSRSSDFFL